MSLARLVVTAVRLEGRTKAEVARDYGSRPGGSTSSAGASMPRVSVCVKVVFFASRIGSRGPTILRVPRRPAQPPVPCERSPPQRQGAETSAEAREARRIDR